MAMELCLTWHDKVPIIWYLRIWGGQAPLRQGDCVLGVTVRVSNNMEFDVTVLSQGWSEFQVSLDVCKLT